MIQIDREHGLIQEAKKLLIKLHPGIRFSRLVVYSEEYFIANEADKGQVGNVLDHSEQLLRNRPQSLVFCVSSLTRSVINRIEF